MNRTAIKTFLTITAIVFIVWLVNNHNRSVKESEPAKIEQTNLTDPDTNRYYITQNDSIFGDSALITTSVCYDPVNRERIYRDNITVSVKCHRDSLQHHLDIQTYAANKYIQIHILSEEIDNTEKELEIYLKKKEKADKKRQYFKNKFLPSFFLSVYK